MTDGRIGGEPPNGCQARWTDVVVMAAHSRDRVTINLCAVGDAARAAARMRGTTLALFARQAVIVALPGEAAATLPSVEPVPDLGATIKLSVRLSAADSATLATQAAARGMSQAGLVALLIQRTELPLPAAERLAELAALRTSNDVLATIAADVSLFARALSQPSLSALGPLRQRMLNLDADIARHLQIAAALLARID